MLNSPKPEELRTRACAAMLSLAAGLTVIIAASSGSALFSEELRVVTVADPNSALVHLAVAVHSGSADDPQGREGLAHMTARLLRSSLLSPRRDERDAARPGGCASLSISVTLDTMAFLMDMPRETADECYPLFRDAILKPPFDPAEIEKARSDAKGEIERAWEDGDDLAERALCGLLYRHHAYGHLVPGRTGALDAITRDDLLGFHRSHFLKGNIVAGVAGRFDEGLVERMRADFGALPEGSPQHLQRTTTFLGRRRVLVVETGKPGETRITIGHPLVLSRAHPDYAPLQVAVAYLGGTQSPVGRLQGELAETRRLSRSAVAGMRLHSADLLLPSFPLDLPREMALTASLDVAPPNAKFAIQLAIAELETLARTGVPADRLEDVKGSLARRLDPTTEDPLRTLAAAMGDLLDGTPGFISRWPKSIEAATAESVAAAMKAHVHSGRLGIVAVVSDAAAFIDQILSRETKIEFPPGVDPEATRSRDLEIVGIDLGLKREDFEVVKAADLLR